MTLMALINGFNENRLIIFKEFSCKKKFAFSVGEDLSIDVTVSGMFSCDTKGKSE